MDIIRNIDKRNSTKIIAFDGTLVGYHYKHVLLNYNVHNKGTGLPLNEFFESCSRKSDASYTFKVVGMSINISFFFLFIFNY